MAPEWNRKSQKSPLYRNQWVIPFLTHGGETMLKVKPVLRHSAPPGKVCVNEQSSSVISKSVLDHLWPQRQISHHVPSELSANLHTHGGGWDFSNGVVLFGLHCHFCSRMDGAGSREAPCGRGLSPQWGPEQSPYSLLYPLSAKVPGDPGASLTGTHPKMKNTWWHWTVSTVCLTICLLSGFLLGFILKGCFSLSALPEKLSPPANSRWGAELLTTAATGSEFYPFQVKTDPTIFFKLIGANKPSIFGNWWKSGFPK